MFSVGIQLLFLRFEIAFLDFQPLVLPQRAVGLDVVAVGKDETHRGDLHGERSLLNGLHRHRSQ